MVGHWQLEANLLGFDNPPGYCQTTQSFDRRLFGLRLRQTANWNGKPLANGEPLANGITIASLWPMAWRRVWSLLWQGLG